MPRRVTWRRKSRAARRSKTRSRLRLGKRKGGAIALVNRLLRKEEEVKFVSNKVENNIAHNSAIGASDIYNVMPSLQRGDADNQRDGDKVRVKSLHLRGYVGVDRNYSSDNRPIQVRIAVLQYKGIKRWNEAVNAWGIGDYQNLLRVNSGGGATTSKPYNGDQLDNFYPINRELFRVLGERFITLNPQQLAQGGAAPPGSVESGYMVAKKFNFKIKCPKTLQYLQNASLPQNFAPFVSVGYMYLDGGNPDVVPTRIVVDSLSTMYFTDS